MQSSRHGKIGSPESEIERRANQIGWIIDYFSEIQSDFSVFFRIDDVSDLDGAFFFERAMLLFAYQGALRCRLEYELSLRKGQEDAWKSRFNGKNRPSKPRTTLGADRSFTVNGPEDVRSPEFDGLIEFA